MLTTAAAAVKAGREELKGLAALKERKSEI
jgi:hypothetical protein